MKCSTPSCPREGTVATLCKACYSGHYYWKKQPIAKTMERKTQLVILGERLDDIRPANVVHIRRNRRRAA